MKTGLPSRALRLVPYLTPEEIRQLCGGCRGRQQDRDALLTLVLFQNFSQAHYPKPNYPDFHDARGEYYCGELILWQKKRGRLFEPTH